MGVYNEPVRIITRANSEGRTYDLQASQYAGGYPRPLKTESVTMAIYHLSTKPISRASGRSATASAAYRASEKITDQLTGEVHDYSRKQGVLFSGIVTPNNEPVSRSDLWNKAELAEKRKDARVAREIVIALPDELSAEERQELTLTFANKISESYGVAIDVCIHEPSRGGDDRNHHAHLLMTTRKVELKDGEFAIGDKASLELSDKKLRELGRPTGAQQIEAIRALWADMSNRCLEHYGHDERISEKSYADQGIDQTPTVKMGVEATAMERRGESSERGDLNRAVAFNNEKKELLKQLADLQAQLKVAEAEEYARAQAEAQAQAIARAEAQAEREAKAQAEALEQAKAQEVDDKLARAKEVADLQEQAKALEAGINNSLNMSFDDYLRLNHFDENKHHDDMVKGKQNKVNQLAHRYNEVMQEYNKHSGIFGNRSMRKALNEQLEKIKPQHESASKEYRDSVTAREAFLSNAKELYEKMKNMARAMRKSVLEPILERLQGVNPEELREAKHISAKEQFKQAHKQVTEQPKRERSITQERSQSVDFER